MLDNGLRNANLEDVGEGCSLPHQACAEMPNYRSSQVDAVRRRLEAEQLLNPKLWQYDSFELYVFRNVVAWVLAFFFFYLVIY